MAGIKENISLFGHGTVEVHDAKTGALLYREDYTNVITDYVRENMILSLKGTPTSWEITHIAIGSDGTAASSSQTALGNELIRSLPTQIIDYTAYQVGYRLFFSASQNNGDTFREIGLFDASTGGNMFARSVSFTPITKNSNITVTFTHKISI